MADQFCLRWNNFQSNIVNALDSLKCSEDLVDVTLTCEGRNIKAHKVILSACSPYFRNVFKENPCQHPVIILKDVLAEDIVSLLSYMYQGEVFIEESKLTSFLHTAAMLQVKGLTGVTQQRETFQPNTSNKLYTQLTISPKPTLISNKDAKLPGLKKRRCSTSDKPNDITIGNGKKSKVLEACEIYKNIPNLLKDGVPIDNNNVEKKNEIRTEQIVTTNGKSGLQQASQSPVANIKTEQTEDPESPLPALIMPPVSPDIEDSPPDYENSMLARSLLSGKHPMKSDISANNSQKKTNNKPEIKRSKDDQTNERPNTLSSPQKVEETVVKSEKHSPKPEVEYEPEVLLSEQTDGNESEGYTEQSQALMLLAGMSSASILGASTSQMSHQSNHAAICGDCPHCGMKYSNQSALKYHVRLMHSDLTNRLCCYLCPRSFTMRETFKEHMWTTHGQRN